MPYQAELLLSRFRKEKSCDWEKDWKLVTLFVGVSSLFLLTDQALQSFNLVIGQ